MLSEEEKKAIEIVKSWINCFENQEDETPKIHKTVLNLITKLQKENEEKDKQIDLMSEYIYNTQMECNIYYKDKEEVKNKFAKM